MLIIPFVFSCNAVGNKTATDANKREEVKVFSPPNNKDKAEKSAPLLVSNDAGATWEAVSANLPADLQWLFLIWSPLEIKFTAVQELGMNTEKESTRDICHFHETIISYYSI